MKKGIFDIEEYSFEADTSELAELENELKKDKEATSREWLEYQGAKWIKEDYCIEKSVIRDKLNEIRKKAEIAQTIELLIFDSKRDVLEEILGRNKYESK